MKPQDLLVALKLATFTDPEPSWTYAWLASELGLSVSETHAAVKRGLKSGLLRQNLHGGIGPHPRELMDFLVHGVRFVFPAERTGLTRGMKTSVAAALFPMLSVNKLLRTGNEYPFVWPDSEGDTQGPGLVPLYPSVPAAARKDARLHELLALVDALRDGRQREKQIAGKQIEALLKERLLHFEYNAKAPEVKENHG